MVLGQPANELGVPQQTARHHSPADDLAAMTGSEFEGLIAADPNSLSDPELFASAGMLIDQLDAKQEIVSNARRIRLGRCGEAARLRRSVIRLAGARVQADVHAGRRRPLCP
jgi:hypothetical protein